MRPKGATVFMVLAAFALLLSCQTAVEKPPAAGPGGNIRIVKLTVPDCG